MSQKHRSNYTADQKVAILRRHLLDNVPVSQLCDEYHLQPIILYRWQKLFFDNGAAAFSVQARKDDSPLERKVAALEQKLAQKNEVVSELMEEHIKLEKELGEL